MAGVYDVKNLRRKIRPDEVHKYNSPWNIAADFKVDMSFSREEIAVIPFIKAAGKLSSGLKIIASPWSPPPYMKNNGQWQGGYLKSE